MNTYKIEIIKTAELIYAHLTALSQQKSIGSPRELAENSIYRAIEFHRVASQLLEGRIKPDMSTDRELLELAAKAARLTVRWHEKGCYGPTMEIMEDESGGPPWNPLTNDGDALRLAVHLRISLESDAVIEVDRFTPKNHTEGEYKMGVEAWQVLSNPVLTIKAQELYKDNPYATTRRAIVRAAAAIGEQLKETK